MCMKSKWLAGYVHSAHASSISNLRFGGALVYSIGLRSVAVTSASGNLSATSTAQRPVPDPTSKMRDGLVIGARNRASCRVSSHRWCTTDS